MKINPLSFCNLIVFLLLIFISQPTLSQNIHIKGSVIDTNSTTGIANAKAILIRLKDSVIVAHQTTDKNGQFEFSNIPVDTFRMIIEHFKYETRDFYFFANENNSDFKLNNMVLFERGKKIDEVTIFAYKDPVHFKGDTLVYIADSFKTRPNAVVEDLLKKLPGITVEKNGAIKSQGKDISRIYVDGDEFFGSDATLATKNLAANSVERVQVYETLLPDASSTDEKVKVLNLELKDSAKKGYFGKVAFGTDFMNYFEGQALFNKFSKNHKIAAYFLSTNTTRSTLSWSDANEYGVKSGDRYNYNAETDSWEANNNFISTDDGFPLSFKTGLFYSGQVNEKLKITANYAYNDYRKKTYNTNKTQYFLSDTSYSNNAESTANLRFMGHEANLLFSYKIDSTQTIKIHPQFTISNRSNLQNDLSGYFNSEGVSTRNSSNVSNTNSQATNIKALIDYTKKFKKDKREFRIFNNFIYDVSGIKSNQQYNDYFTQTNLYENEIDQQYKSDRSIISNIISASYTEPLTKKWRIVFNYELFTTTNQQIKNNYNNNNGNYDQLDSITSGNFKSIKLQNKLGASLHYDFKKHSLKIGFTGRNVLIDNQNLFVHSVLKQNNTTVLPNFMYKFKISKNSEFRISANANSTLPDINFLQPIANNANPNSIFIGNSNLKPSYTASSNISYNIYNPMSGGYLWTGVNSSYGWNQLISTTQFDAIGRRITSYQNGNTLNFLSGYLNGGIPLIKQVLSLEPEIGYQYSNRINYVDNLKNTLVVHAIEPSIGISAELDVVDISFGFDYAFTSNKNTISSNMNLDNQMFGLYADVGVYLDFGMEITTDFEYKNYRNLSDGYNAKPFIWNASIEQTLGKNKSWELKLQVFDILNQNIKIQRSATSNMIIDSRTSIISRYFLFTLGYKFNSTFKKNATPKNEQ